MRPPATASVVAAVLLAWTMSGGPAPGGGVPWRERPPAVVPKPVSSTVAPGQSFTFADDTRIVVRPRTPQTLDAARALARVLRPSTGLALPVVGFDGTPVRHDVLLTLGHASGLGREGYRLAVARSGVVVRARTSAGLFYGVQTLRQMLPPQVERDTPQPGPWTLRGGVVSDHPRYAWRGAMLDVARHFFDVHAVERYVDLLATYKMNVLHLHLTDDQGWRLAIRGWPRLTSHGGSTEVGGGRGGFYTQAEYAEIVRYAQARHVTVVPEIDMPGHVTAALSSYPKLSCDGAPRPLETSAHPQFSSLCTDKAVTYRFVRDVVRQVAALTPGRYVDVGGDEAGDTSHADYAGFVHRVRAIVRHDGKHALGWEEIAGAGVHGPSVAQYWQDPDAARTAVAHGMKLVVSPAAKVYLDMKYDPGTRLGLTWAGYSSVRDAYRWDPATRLPGVPDSAVLGPEAPLWTETVTDLADAERLAFPRLVGVAEIGWSPRAGRSWAGYRRRLAHQGPRWDAMRVHYDRSPQVPWASGP